MMKNILCIGTCSNPKTNSFTGQSVMFDGVVSYLKQNNYRVKVVDISQRFKGGGALFRSIDYFIAFAKIVYSLCLSHYDLAYIITAQSKNGFRRDAIMIKMCRWFCVPVITHQYGANYKQLTDSLGEKGLARLINMLDYVSSIIVEGDYMKDQFSFFSDYNNKVKVIPNGLPVEGLHALSAKEYDGKQPFILFYLSNLIWTKGYFDVLRAVDVLVNQNHLNVKCVFAGRFMASVDDERTGISNKEDFDAFVQEHDLSDRIEYHQGLYGEEKDRYFFNSNVFILPTYYINEGQPVSIIEAMAYGCVPLVTEYRHIPMMINEANGCFVKPQDPKDIACHIKYLIDNPDIYAAKSKQSITDYQQKFKFDVYAQKVVDCINSVIS